MELGEPELVRDVLFACQGIDGRSLRFDARRGAYVVDDAARVSPGARRLAEKLAECGWLFRKVRAHAEVCAGEAEEGTTTDPTDPTDPTDTEADADRDADRGGAGREHPAGVPRRRAFGAGGVLPPDRRARGAGAGAHGVRAGDVASR